MVVKRPLSCAAVAIQIEVRTGYRPHPVTVRRWVEEDLELGRQYLAMPKRFLIYPDCIEVIISKRVRRDQDQ